MNTSLISHIMNQRLKKGEIWPSWWDLAGWRRDRVVPFLYIGVLLGGRLFFSWALAADVPLVAVGRTIYFAGVLAVLAVLFDLPLNYFQRGLKRELEPHNLQLSLLADGSISCLLGTWFVSDLLMLLLRLLRYVPLFAIAAMAGGITWIGAAGAVVFAALIATALLALLYAATITDPFRYVVEVILALLIGWWIYRNIGSSVLTFGPAPYRYYLTLLVAVSVGSLLWSDAVLTLRVRWRGRWSVRGRRLHQKPYLKRWPTVTLLVRGLRGGLGIFGSMPLIAVITLACIGIGLIPTLGGVILLIGLSMVVPRFVMALHRSGAWEDVFLASDSTRVWSVLPANTARDWTRTLCAACCIAALPAVPGAVIHVMLGRFVLGNGWSVIQLGQAIAERGESPVTALALALGLSLIAAASAIAFTAALVVASLESLVQRAAKKSAEAFSLSPAAAVVVVVTVIASVVLAVFAQQAGSAFEKLLWIAGLYGVVGLGATFVCVWSYRGLCYLMERAGDLTAADYEEAQTNTWANRRRERSTPS